MIFSIATLQVFVSADSCNERGSLKTYKIMIYCWMLTASLAELPRVTELKMPERVCQEVGLPAKNFVDAQKNVSPIFWRI
jgi:hypothetical protein